MTAPASASPGPAGWLHGRDYKVVQVDDGRSLVFLTHNHRLLEVSSALGERLERGLSELTAGERSEWELLEAGRVLESVNPTVLARAGILDGANLALNINLTGTCNLACTYCFADGGDYGRIRSKMQRDMIPSILGFVRQHRTRSNTVRFELFGGEPLLNFDMIRELAEEADKVSADTGIQFIYRISTNLTVLPPGAVEMFRDRRVIVSVSVDGGRETHDRNRPTKGGRSSFDTIIGNCRQVRAASDEVTMVARMTVTESAGALIDDVRELYALDLFDFFQIYPAVTPQQKRVSELTHRKEDRQGPTMPSTFLGQLAALLRIYPSLFRPDNRFRGVLECERIVDMIVGGKMALSFCGAGSTYFTFSPDDSITPCHRLVGQPGFQVGSGKAGLTREPSEWRLRVDQHPVCSACWARYVCGGNCREENFVATGDIRTLNPETCSYQQELLGNVARMLASQPADYRRRDRRELDDLFISCGRPVVESSRPTHSVSPSDLVHFRVLA